ncbi:PAS domain-containing sensor histidine kinase [Oceanibium sediminis]|uniref:PAS domain-containing sensor histidine kinase n=1 Tax=Oceanibium sediminis TaxID=2026339 RepID=UPI000DD328A3|nr:PAS domain-containing sensor histidine kinase [Oceanibium sediminis]
MDYWNHEGGDPFDVFFLSAPIMMQSLDADGTIERVSRFWADTLGYDPSEMEGKNVTRFISRASRIHADDLSNAQYFRRGRLYNAEYEFLRKDGSVLSVLMSAVAQHKPDGSFLRSLAVLFDNSEAKRATALLNQKQRTEALGRLVTGVAHDFSNVLSVIQGSLELLEEDPDRADRDSRIHDARMMAERGAELTDQLRTFGRQANLSPRTMDLNAHLVSSTQMLRRFMPEAIEFEAVISSGIWPVKLDMQQLDIALLNLVGNAIDAMHGRGKITVETANIELTPQNIGSTMFDIPAGRYVMLAVSDTGDGIAPEDMERVFDPFFTTKTPGNGSGMGLSMVQGFVKQSRGTVNLFSELGFGTTIRMYFPAVGGVRREDSWHDDPALSERAPADAVGEDILVVEDEEGVRKVLVAQLRSKGYSVTEAANGDIALSLLSAGYRPRVMLSDKVMPGLLQGPELAARAKELAPGIKVVLMSGYIGDDGPMIHPADDSVDVHLAKPVPRSILLNAIQRLMKPT